MELLLHFTNYSSINKIIKSCGLKFGNLHNSNDPFEHYDLIGDIFTEDNYHYYDREESWETNFQRFYKTICFSYVNNKKFDSRAINETIMKPRMWSQYSNSLKDLPGAAIILDKKKFEEELSKLEPTFKGDNISYDLKIEFCNALKREFEKIFNSRNMEKIISLYYDSGILFKKHRDWQSENEYRYVINSDKIENLIVPIESSLLAIVTDDFDLHNTRKYEISDLLKKSKMNLTKPIEEIVHDIKWELGFSKVISIKNHEEWLDGIKPNC